jgi:hypothetical protein
LTVTGLLMEGLQQEIDIWIGRSASRPHLRVARSAFRISRIRQSVLFL